MKQLFYLMLAGLLLFAVPSIASTTGSAETNVVEVDIGYDVCEQAADFRLTLSEQYSPTAVVKRSDGKFYTESYSFITFTGEESTTLADRNSQNGLQPHLTGTASTPFNYSYRKAREGLTHTV